MYQKQPLYFVAAADEGLPPIAPRSGSIMQWHQLAFVLYTIQVITVIGLVRSSSSSVATLWKNVGETKENACRYSLDHFRHQLLHSTSCVTPPYTATPQRLHSMQQPPLYVPHVAL